MWIAQQFSTLIEYFVPEPMRSDREAADQARMFLISHTLGPIIGNSVPLALYLFDPTPSIEIAILSLSITSFWLFPFLLKAGFNYDRLVLVSVAILNFSIFWSCWFNGGIGSPTLTWVLVIPLLSFFYIGGNRAMRRPLLAIFALSGLGFFGLYQWVEPANNDVPEAAGHALALVSNIAALLYVAIMAVYYARVFDRSLELEAEVRRRHVLSRELRSAVAQSTEASQAKAQFLARMSHELRTPLNAVIGYSEVLREDMEEDGNTTLLPDVNRINQAGKYLLRLINSILDISKIDAGRMQIDNQSHDFRNLLGKIVDQCTDLAGENGSRIELAYDASCREIVTDAEKVSSILQNVVANAAQYTKAGLVRIEVTSFSQKDRDFYKVAVCDNGPGIETKDLDNLFELHGASRDASQSQYGGTGMSLIVSRKMVRTLGGDIEVESQTNQGSTFTVIVPVKAADAAATKTHEAIAFADRGHPASGFISAAAT